MMSCARQCCTRLAHDAVLFGRCELAFGGTFTFKVQDAMEFSETGGSNLHSVMFKWHGLPARWRHVHKVSCLLGTAPRWTPLSSLLFVKQKNRGAFRFAAHTNARENKSQEVALNAPVSAGHAGDLSDETRIIRATITKWYHYCRDFKIP